MFAPGSGLKSPDSGAVKNAVENSKSTSGLRAEALPQDDLWKAIKMALPHAEIEKHPDDVGDIAQSNFMSNKEILRAVSAVRGVV